MLGSIYAQIRAMRIQRNHTLTHLPQSCDDHEELMKALRKRDPDLAENRARSHIRDLAEEIGQRRPAESPRNRPARNRIAS
jgi:DNA-binding GntR family transcriptional regulator